MTDYQRYGQVYEEVQAIVGKIGNVRMVTGVGYTAIIATFKFNPGEVKIDDYYGRIIAASGDDSQTKLTGERDGQGRIAIRIQTTFPTPSPEPEEITKGTNETL